MIDEQHPGDLRIIRPLASFERKKTIEMRMPRQAVRTMMAIDSKRLIDQHAAGRMSPWGNRAECLQTWPVLLRALGAPNRMPGNIHDILCNGRRKVTIAQWIIDALNVT
jgi:hypothetical protein